MENVELRGERESFYLGKMIFEREEIFPLMMEVCFEVKLEIRRWKYQVDTYKHWGKARET